MVEDSGRPGICRSNTGVAETEEPCTKRIAPLGAFSVLLRHMNRRTFSPSTCFVVQCSLPLTGRDCSPELRENTRSAAAPAVPARSERRCSSMGYFDENAIEYME